MIYLLYPVEAPDFVPDSNTPASGAELFPNHTTFAISFDKQVRLLSSQSNIHVCLIVSRALAIC